MKVTQGQLDHWMVLALKEAEKAAELGEVPIGALVIKDDAVISSAHNEVEYSGIATAHAEKLAIERASVALGRWRLNDCILVATIEPCPLCAGSTLLARIPTIVYGAADPRYGALGSLFDLAALNPFGAAPRVISGIRAHECGRFVQEFFRKRRTA